MGAHPRSRGENKAVSTLARKHVGSSPLTRGKPEYQFCEWLLRRLIPAHAGKTADHRSMPVKASAHPRSRGENIPDDGMDAMTLGSSPLTRGKRGRPTFFLLAAQAHPRSRGENGHSKGTPKCTPGSSPLTRGKPHGFPGLPRPPRLIPAHAGKTISEHANSDAAQAHPRSRGENPAEGTDRELDAGSSPLTRGKHMLPSWKGPEDRLIPAHAGKTSIA